MDYLEKYQLWLDNVEDESLKQQLLEMKGDNNLIEERFYKDISFGTGGIRGVLGVGTDNMNIYNVKKAVQGLCSYYKGLSDDTSIAISFDNRNFSKEFAREAAMILAGNGIKVHLTKELQPTPFLSFMVRELKCDGGIMVTASHNPAKYNGLKAYNSDGAQLADVAANLAISYINKLEVFSEEIKSIDFNEGINSGLINYVSDEVYISYMDKLKNQSFFIKNNEKANNISVAYTPLYGTGLHPVTNILEAIGVESLHIVKEQSKPDGNFPTTPNPNPELVKTMEMGIALAKKYDCDILIGTDPDADRLGVGVKDNDDYIMLTGNEVGVLMFDYIIKRTKTLPKNPVAVRSIVSTALFDKIAEENEISVKTVLTGFKYIADYIKILEDKGQEDRYVFGFEESCGYLYGTYARDKDAVNAAMIVCEMASYYKSLNTSLLEVLNSIYNKYGYYHHETLDYTFEGRAGQEKMKDILKKLRANPPKAMMEKSVVEYKDYNSDKVSLEENLPKSDVLYLLLDDGNSLTVRPSGTEPKIKFYYTIISSSKELAIEQTKDFVKEVECLLNL